MTHDTPAPDASFLIERMNTWSQRAISEKRRAEAAEAEVARLTAERDALRAELELVASDLRQIRDEQEKTGQLIEQLRAALNPNAK